MQYLLPGIYSSSLVGLNFNNTANPYLDAIQQAGIEIILSDVSGNGSVIVGKYNSEPPGDVAFSDGTISGGTGKTGIVFVDVQIEGYDHGTARVTIHFTNGEINNFDQNSLSMAYFSDNKWVTCDNIVVSLNHNTIAGDIPISQLTGTVVGLGGTLITNANGVPFVLSNAPPVSSVPWVLIVVVTVSVLFVFGIIFVSERSRRKKTSSK